MTAAMLAGKDFARAGWNPSVSNPAAANADDARGAP